jgi:hypothetical protein
LFQCTKKLRIGNLFFAEGIELNQESETWRSKLCLRQNILSSLINRKIERCISMTDDLFTEADLKQMEKLGISEDEA